MEEANKELPIQKHHRLKFFKEKKDFNLGSFKIKAFPLEHDVKTTGFLIEEESMGRLVFITDTQYCRYSFEGLNHILIEANYCENLMNERLISGSLQGYLRNRIMNSHMSLNSTKEFLKANDLSQVSNVILCHLSDGNSDESRFIKEVRELTGKAVYVADKGREFNLDKNPF